MRFFIGPVTKNTVDTVISYSEDHDANFVFIPSRRQIENTGGYVNGFTTELFTDYVRSRTNKVLIERDHGGPGQGKTQDDGYESLREDCKHFDLIHIDPWKKYAAFDDALKWTVDMINFCYALNPQIEYEVGTEEGIRPIEADELDQFATCLRAALQPEVFAKIKYLVIQCGTRLLEQSNIGVYNEEKLAAMLNVCKKHGLTAKEHNGDWISPSVVESKSKAGLTCINIAPEFGEIESSVLIKKFSENPEDLEEFYNICYESGAWKKWVSADFIPHENKIKLIKICGHYVLSTPQFLSDIKSNFPNIDKEIQNNINNKLNELYS
jgi:fructose/tagatose bisphosphate aldolase